ncbi:MAG TPA: M1 family metallopeptidase [Chitinophagaceae bacterium]|nr:M1 family metallopeptidase [Chitinophagaceae bacterium]
MRIISLLIFIFCFQVAAFTQNTIDVLNYKFNIGLNDVSDTIYGVAEIKVRFLQPVNEVSFDLTNAKDKGKGMKVGKLQGSYIRGTIYKEESFRILLSQNMNIGDTATFVIPYSGVPADGLIISKTKYGHRSFFGDNWPNRGHNWIPCHDDPADKATVEFIVTAPEHYQVVANGVQIEETSLGNSFKLTHWKEDTPISTKVMVIGAADFAVNLAGIVNGNIPVYSWVYPENKDKGFYDYAQANEILEYYITHIGPYGYKKLANVQSKTRFGGLENANTIFYSENSVSGTRKSEGLLAHEIAHQWFGNMATEKSFGHLWLSEGFATYFTILYFENKYGKDTAIKMLKEDRSQVIDFSKETNKAIVDTEETDYMKLLNANSYQKGGWVLHMLRCELGDSVFWRSIRKYYGTYAGSVADTRDLQKVFEEVSGKNLNQFFDQWLYTAGQPDLDITWQYDAIGKFVNVDVKQQQKNAFNFPLSLKINSSGTGKKEKIFVKEAAASFKIKVDQKPTAIILDPDTELLMKSSIKEK